MPERGIECGRGTLAVPSVRTDPDPDFMMIRRCLIVEGGSDVGDEFTKEDLGQRSERCVYRLKANLATYHVSEHISYHVS